MLEIIYASAAVSSFAEDDLRTLLARARLNNSRLGITGMLLHDNGSFLQVLEGDPVSVKMLFAKIALDPRHKRVVTLQEGVTRERSFQSWTMGLVSLAKVRSLEGGLSAALGSTDLAHYAKGRGEASRARELLLGFCQGRWRTYIEG